MESKESFFTCSEGDSCGDDDSFHSCFEEIGGNGQVENREEDKMIMVLIKLGGEEPTQTLYTRPDAEMARPILWKLQLPVSRPEEVFATIQGRALDLMRTFRENDVKDMDMINISPRLRGGT